MWWVCACSVCAVCFVYRVCAICVDCVGGDGHASFSYSFLPTTLSVLVTAEANFIMDPVVSREWGLTLRNIIYQTRHLLRASHGGHTKISVLTLAPPNPGEGRAGLPLSLPAQGASRCPDIRHLLLVGLWEHRRWQIIQLSEESESQSV